MRRRLNAVALAVLALLLAFFFIYRPLSEANQEKLDALARNDAEIAAYMTSQVAQARIGDEAHALQHRLGDVGPRDVNHVDDPTFRSITLLARRTGVQLDAIEGRSTTAVAAVASPSPRPTPALASPPPNGVAADAPPAPPPIVAVDASRVPLNVTVTGRFNNILRFVDGLGSLRELISVKSLDFVQDQQLRAVIGCDIVVIAKDTEER